MEPIAFLFDNDGVLVDSSEMHWKAWELLQEEDPALPMDRELFQKGFGKRNDLILKDVAPHVSEETRRRWADRKEELFRKVAPGKVDLLPGMEAFLKVLKKENIPRIIASSTPIKNLEMFLTSTVLGEYFELYLSAEEVPHGKPFPDIFLAAADRLGFKPRDSIVIEDAPAGIEAGKKAGCFVIALATTHTRDQLKGWDLLYGSAAELNLKTITAEFVQWKKRNRSGGM